MRTKKILKYFFFIRWMRTIPLFILAVILYSLIFQRFDYDTLKYFLLIQNFFPNFLDLEYISILWSLSIEEYFYLAFPILIIIFNKVKISNLVIYSIIIFLILNIFASFFLNLTDLRINTFFRLDSIIYGICLRLYSNLFKKKINYIIFTLTIFYFIYAYFTKFSNNNFNDLEKFLFIFNIKLLSVYFCLFFISTENYLNKFKSFGNLLSNQTYSVYLFHLLFIYIFDTYFLIHQYSIILYLLSIFVFSIIIYNFFEKPINNLRPKFKK